MSEQKKLDPAPLVKRLTEKSTGGKVNWEPTADRQAFIASVGGDTSFKIRLVTTTDIDQYGQPETVQVPRLDMLDQKGHLLWDVEQKDVPAGELWRLFEVVRRIGNRLDDRLAGAIDALDKL